MTSDLVEQLRQQKQIAPTLAIGHFRVVANPVCEQAADELERLRAENTQLWEATVDATASLAAAISLLERGGKKAAPSDAMFAQMVEDYKASLQRARTALTGGPNEPK